MSAANAAISSVSMRAGGAERRESRAAAFSGVSARLCRISARSLALAPKNMSLISAASFGCIDKFDAIRNCASVGGLAGAARAGTCGNLARERNVPIGTGGFQSELSHAFRPACPDRSPAAPARPRASRHRPDRSGARSVRRTAALRRRCARWPARRDRSARAAGSAGYRRPRGARASSARQTRKQRRCGHVRITRLSNARVRLRAVRFNSALRKTTREDRAIRIRALVIVPHRIASAIKMPLTMP